MISMGKRYSAALLAVIVCVTAGCAGLGRHLEPPTIHVAGIRLESITGFETTFRVDLRVINADTAPLTITGVACDLDINGQRFATGVTDRESTIPALGSDIVSLTVYSSVLDMVRSVMTMPGKSAVDYQLSGRLHLGGGAIPETIPFSTSGQLSAAEFDRSDRP